MTTMHPPSGNEKAVLVSPDRQLDLVLRKTLLDSVLLERDNKADNRSMRALIKNALRGALTPVLRAVAPAFEDLKRMRAYLMLGARIQHPIDHSVVVMGVPEVRGTGQIKLGRNLLLYPDLYLETQGNGLIEIGDDVVMSRGVHVVAHDAVRIGAGTMIGEYTSIRDANHVRDAKGAMRDGAHVAMPIHLGSQVWIGRGVTILCGVSIGDNATVGANAVVTRDVPPGITVAGVPAVPLRSGVRLSVRASNE